ncbi:MAG: hypothetical protein VCE43_01915, partial [Myxococcota bacterium]
SGRAKFFTAGRPVARPPRLLAKPVAKTSAHDTVHGMNRKMPASATIHLEADQITTVYFPTSVAQRGTFGARDYTRRSAGASIANPS